LSEEEETDEEGKYDTSDEGRRRITDPGSGGKVPHGIGVMNVGSGSASTHLHTMKQNQTRGSSSVDTTEELKRSDIALEGA